MNFNKEFTIHNSCKYSKEFFCKKSLVMQAEKELYCVTVLGEVCFRKVSMCNILYWYNVSSSK